MFKKQKHGYRINKNFPTQKDRIPEDTRKQMNLDEWISLGDTPETRGNGKNQNGNVCTICGGTGLLEIELEIYCGCYHCENNAGNIHIIDE